jgi:UrcA family protein
MSKELSMFQNLRNVALAALTMLAMSFTCELAQAESNDPQPDSVTVQYHRADLDTPQGVATLYRRIRAAAATVCRPLESNVLERTLLHDECFSHAVANAVRTVHNARLNAYHMQRIRGWGQPREEAPVSLAGQ